MVHDDGNFHRLYYFTADKYAKELIENREIKISTFDALNDSHEFKNFDTSGRENRGLRAGLDKIIHKYGKVNGLICLSKSWRNPLMWGFYADRGCGVCLGFDVPKLDGNDAVVSPIIYEADKIPLKQFDLIKDQNVLLNKLLFTKFVGWKHEQEMRLIVRKADCRSVPDPDTNYARLFHPLDGLMVLKQVYLGQNCSTQVSEYQDKLEAAGYGEKVEVNRVRPAFGEYRYTIQENERCFDKAL